jgi:hypothetical protein
MDLPEQRRVTCDREWQLGQMPEERHSRRSVFIQQSLDRAREFVDRVRP